MSKKKEINNPNEVEERTNMDENTESIFVSCTQEEYEVIRIASENAGLSISDYLLSEYEKNTEILTLIDEVTNSEKKLDEQMDQMAKEFNDPGYVVSDNDLKKFISQLNQVSESTDSSIERMDKIIKLLSE